MSIVNSGKREFRYFPHCGRVFVANQVFGIVDAWQAADAFSYVQERGTQWVNDFGVTQNPGHWQYSVGSIVTDRYMHHEPVAGMSGDLSDATTGVGVGYGFRFITQGWTARYTANFGGEINSQHDSYCLGLDFRFLTPLEFSSSALHTGMNGDGARGQRLTVTLVEISNPSFGNTQTLVDIFCDWNWYFANVSPLIPAQTAANVIDLSQGATIFEPWGAINSGILIDKIDSALRKLGSCAAYLAVHYELPRRPDGAAWSGTTGVFDYVKAFEVTHPANGIPSRSWGCLGVSFSTFRSGTYTAPTTAAGVQSRSQAAFPTTADATIGQVMDAPLWADLHDRGVADRQVSWPAFFAGRRSFGGLHRIVLGDTGRWRNGTGNLWKMDDTALQQLETEIQVPSDATKFTMMANVRYIAGVGLHSIEIRIERDYLNILNQPAVASQVLYTASFASNFGPSWVWSDGLLAANVAHTSGYTERCRLYLKVTKSVPRAANQNSNLSYWDGIGALYLAFR